MATAPRHPRLRRAGALVLALVVAAGGIVGLIAFFATRDTSTFKEVRGPGRELPDQGAARLAPGAPRPRYNSDPPTSGPHVPVPVARDDVALTDDQVLTALQTGTWCSSTPTGACGGRCGDWPTTWRARSSPRSPPPGRR